MKVNKTNLVLVTGGAGFIGSHIVEELVNRNYNVRVLDVLNNSTLQNIQYLIDSKKIEFIHGDIRYKDVVDDAMEDVDYVFHEAGTQINRSVSYPEESFDINLKGSYNVFKGALDHNIKKVMFASSASVYGQPMYLPMDENHPTNPVTPYCISKLASENLLKFLTNNGLKYIALRYFNVYGARQHTTAYYTSVIIHFVNRLLSGEEPIIEGKGLQSMDFIHVSDVVKANMLALDSNIENEVFNVGTGKATTVAELADMLIKVVGVDVKPKFLPRDVIVTERRSDIEKIIKHLKFKPTVNLLDGLKELVEEVKEC